MRGRTTYNEVADALVTELTAADAPNDDGTTCDEKNIRRRVYDAINVLMAMDIMSRERKEIVWCGFPSGGKEREVEALKAERAGRLAALEQKQQRLQARGRRLIWLTAPRAGSGWRAGCGCCAARCLSQRQGNEPAMRQLAPQSLFAARVHGPHQSPSHGILTSEP